MDNLVTFKHRIDSGHLLECTYNRFDEERHKAELNTVFFDESFLVLGSDRFDGCEVDLVESSQHGGFLLGGD